MNRFNILLYLVITGLFGVYQYFPFFETYTLGLINSIYFLGSCIIYFSLLIYEIYLNNQEVKYEKKQFDKSSIWITLILFLSLIIFKEIEFFESKTIIKAKGNFSYTLNLKKNGKFKLKQRSHYESHYYKGEYIMKNDTLRLLNNDELSNLFLIDTVYIKKNDSLISISNTDKFVIIN